MASIVLVHGGSHGAWCWRDCAAALQQAGHDVHCFDLPGHGDDLTPRDQVTVDLHAQAILAELSCCQATSITLVGHSLASIAIARALQASPKAIDRLVLLAAIVLEVGETAIDHIPESRRPSYFDLANASPDQSFFLDFKRARQLFFNDLDDTAAEQFYEKLTPQPLAIYLDKAQFCLRDLCCRKHYIACRDDMPLGLEASLQFAERLQGSSSVLDAGHDVMLSKPKLLCDQLLRVMQLPV
ncbi:MAG: alpha/beta fold hydrolase [Prochlorococcus sp.]